MNNENETEATPKVPARWSFKTSNREAANTLKKDRFGNISVQNGDIKGVLEEDQMNFRGDDPESEGGISATASEDYMTNKIYENMTKLMGKERVDSQIGERIEAEKKKNQKIAEASEKHLQSKSAAANLPNFRTGLTHSEHEEIFNESSFPEDYQIKHDVTADFGKITERTNGFWVTCTSCKEPLPTRARFCPECGTEVDTPKACESCNHKFTDSEKFCPECGRKRR